MSLLALTISDTNPFHFSHSNNDNIATFMQVPLDAISPHSSANSGDDTFSRCTFLLQSLSLKSSSTSGSSKATNIASTKASTSSSQSSSSSTMLSGSSSGAPKAPPRVSCTKAVPLAPVAKPPKLTQVQPFEPNTNKMAKSKKTKLKTHEQGIVESDTEDVECSVALSSPVKKGARMMSQVRIDISLIMSCQFSNYSHQHSICDCTASHQHQRI